MGIAPRPATSPGVFSAVANLCVRARRECSAACFQPMAMPCES